MRHLNLGELIVIDNKLYMKEVICLIRVEDDRLLLFFDHGEKPTPYRQEVASSIMQTMWKKIENLYKLRDIK